MKLIMFIALVILILGHDRKTEINNEQDISPQESCEEVRVEEVRQQLRQQRELPLVSREQGAQAQATTARTGRPKYFEGHAAVQTRQQP